MIMIEERKRAICQIMK